MTDLTALVAAQRRHVLGGGSASEDSRRETLQRLMKAIAASEGDLLDALRQDLGKSAAEAYVSELEGVLAECGHALANLGRWMKPERRRMPMMARPGTAEVHREPCGSVLIISPWNYPVFLSLTPMVGALAAGCSVVLKPSERAPHVAAALERMLSKVVPSETVAVVTGGATEAAALLDEPFDHFFFTGSRATGLKVAAAAARHAAPVTLELGGKCPVLMFSSSEGGRKKLAARLKLAAKRIAWGKYLNAGQTCVAPDYVLVEKGLYAPLLEALGEAFDSFGGRDYGNLVDRRHFDQLRAYLGQGTVAYGGAIEEEGLSISPTILTGVAEDAEVMREEIFGPVLPIFSCDGLDDALQILAAHPDPLAVYPFTEDRQVEERIRREVRSGAVCVNDVVVHVAGVDLPFGGIGNSGVGRYRGKAGFDLFTRERVILRRGLLWEIPVRFPPLPLVSVLRRVLPWLR